MPSPTAIEETLCFYLSGSHTGLPLQCNISVCIYTVGATLCGRPKRHLNINLKFGLQFFPNKPTFPLDLRAEALGKLSFVCPKVTMNFKMQYFCRQQTIAIFAQRFYNIFNIYIDRKIICQIRLTQITALNAEVILLIQMTITLHIMRIMHQCIRKESLY